MRKIDPAGIPAKVCLEKERTEAAGEIRLAISRIHDALRHLQDFQDFEAPLSANPNDWQEALKKADKRKDEALKAIASNMMLPQENKMELVGDWKEWHKNVVTSCNTIIKHLTKFSACKFKYDVNNQDIVPTIPTMEVAEAKAMRDVPVEAKDHAFLLCVVYDAINGLRQWEKEHGVIKNRLEQLLDLDEQKLAERWAEGSVFYPSYQSDGLVLEVRNKSVREYIEGTFV